MKDIKWLGKYCAPLGGRKEDEAQRLNPDDAPIAARVRSRYKEVEASQTKHNGVTGSNNQTENKSQHITYQSNRSEIHSSSSSRTRKQSRSRQLSEGPKKRNQTKSHSKNNYDHREEQVIANKRFVQPTKSEANRNNASSSQVTRADKKMKSVRLSEESSEHRRLEDPDNLPVVEPHTIYIEIEGFLESERQLVGWTCELCKEDVGVSSHFGEMEGEGEGEGEGEEDCDLYPEVSVMPCGHVYHSSCLPFRFGGPNVSNDACIVCLQVIP